MLKIGTVKWKGKCARHPMYDPESDGPGAIKGGCLRCEELYTIHESHRRTLTLMRSFGASVERRKQLPADPNAGRQQSLFS
jgi:hypothetical protein